MKYSGLEEALKNPLDVIELILDEKETSKEIPTDVLHFTNLRKLHVHGPKTEDVPFPKVFLQLPIEYLEITHFRIREVFEFKTLKKLSMASYKIYEDILPLCKHFSELEYLEIWGYLGVKKSLVIPAEIRNLQKLKELEIVSCKLQDLPPEIADLKNLRIIRLRNHDFTEFPNVLIQIPNLESLEFSQCPLVTSLPDEMVNMKNLKNLELWGLFKGKKQTLDEELDEMFKDEDKKELSIPAVLGRMYNLESLLLPRFDFTDISVITDLKKLKILSLASSEFSSLEPITSLSSLEELDFSMNDEIGDIKPLVNLKSLKKLKMKSTYVEDIQCLLDIPSLEELDISSCGEIKDLRPVFIHPGLKKLAADNEIVKKWEKRKEYAHLLDPEKIKSGLNSLELASVEEGLKGLALYVEIYSMVGENAICSVLGINKSDYGEEELIEIKELDRILKDFGKMLSTESLVNIVNSTMISISYDNFKPCLDAIKLLIERKDVNGQNRVVEIFEKSCEYYDSGHRFMSNTVQDQLIDDLFPQFEGEPLVKLLTWCDSGYLSSEYGDLMDALFLPAFSKVTDPEIEEKLLEKFSSYIKGRDKNYVIEYNLLREEYDNHPSKRVREEIQSLRKSLEKKEEPSAEISQEDGIHKEKGIAEQIKDEIKRAHESMDVPAFIEAVKRADQIKDEEDISKIVILYVHNTMNILLKSMRLDEAKQVLKAYMSVEKIIGCPKVMSTGLETGSVLNMQEALASDAVVLHIYSKDDEIFKIAEELLPDQITEGALAYNMACLYSARKNKEKLLYYTKLALELGKKKDQFMRDTDFDAFKEDPDFLKVLNE